MAVHPPDPLLVHHLPAAPHFVGRDDELARLRHAWESGFRGVLALVGLGGAGKTAVAARFLDALLAGAVEPRPGGVFVWSFYQQPDAGHFLEEAYRYFAGGRSSPANGAGLMHLLRESLADGGPYLLVLDGLERVQRQEGTHYGRVEDPLLRGLLARLAEGIGRASALVTSRFPLTDFFVGRASHVHGYRHLDVGGLPPGAALHLLRQRGVAGDDDALAALVDRYGSHALTLDHLGGLIGQFLGGDPSRAPEAPDLMDPGADRQALRLARLLRAYEEHLPPEELALLCRLCLLRRGANEEHIRHLFLCNPPVRLHTVRELAAGVQRLPVGEGKDRVRQQRALAEAVLGVMEESLAAAPLAGPEEVFRREVLEAVAGAVQAQSQTLGVALEELGHLSAAAAELPQVHRQMLRDLSARYEELCRHPFSPYVKPPAALQQAFADLGWDKSSSTAEDLGPLDVQRALTRVRNALVSLIYKASGLRRVRQLCRTYQRKWTLAGPLAHLDAAGLRAALARLAGRHLVVRESDGTFSVHPAVRDHFGRLAAEERREWHDLLREQMISLARRPGRHLPEDARTLDLVEEAIHHALEAGRRAEAETLYRNVLGGLRHLAWTLGENNRGLRVLRQFDPCPDRWALAWHLRALGELEEAYAHNPLPAFRADVRLLQGRLPEVAREGEPTRTAVARFLMGETNEPPPATLGCAVPRLQVLLYLGLHAAAWRSAGLEQLYGDLAWGGELARCRLLLAELCRRQSDLAAAKYVEEASAWVLHSGSAEHLALLHLVRARLARTAGAGEAAQRAADEGLHVARQCGLGLALVELLCEEGEIALERADPVAAEGFACAALERAVAADCRFAWGEAVALRLWGRALLAQERVEVARGVLTRALDLGRLADPGAGETVRLLASLEG